MKQGYGQLKWAVIAGLLALSVGVAMAQAAPEAPQGTGSTATPPPPAATAPAPSEPRPRGKAAWWGTNVTPGWALMTWAERNEHRKAMRAMKTYDECKAYLDQHHEKMMQRAKERGKEPLPVTSRDACERLKP